MSGDQANYYFVNLTFMKHNMHNKLILVINFTIVEENLCQKLPLRKYCNRVVRNKLVAMFRVQGAAHYELKYFYL